MHIVYVPFVENYFKPYLWLFLAEKTQWHVYPRDKHLLQEDMCSLGHTKLQILYFTKEILNIQANNKSLVVMKSLLKTVMYVVCNSQTYNQRSFGVPW